MKLLNVYNQNSIDWFNYKCLHSYTHRLYALNNTDELNLKSWVEHGDLGITKRKPNEDK